jgi:uncharacterized protein YutE (UPF0331/DUF86 family)/predicted nucleotidyltransferase
VGADVISAVERYFAAHGDEIAAAYVFGSTARRTARADSDVDVGVVMKSPQRGTLASLHIDLEGELERLLGRDVQLVVLDNAPPDLVHRVLRDGILVCDRDRSKRIAIEVRARNDYFDILPVLERYRRRAGSTDLEPVAKNLAFIESCVRELETLARLEFVQSDIRERRFVEHTLQIAIQAALDVASHVVSDERLGEPSTNRELFDLLARAGWLPTELADTMRRMVGFRNIVVHGYTAVDPAIIRDIVEHHLGDLGVFVAAIRGRIGPLAC